MQIFIAGPYFLSLSISTLLAKHTEMAVTYIVALIVAMLNTKPYLASNRMQTSKS
jgi:hypothetical protein